MTDLPWKVFVKTGNIETYLLLKQMEESVDEELFAQDDAPSSSETQMQSDLTGQVK
ncbi:YqzL family protein [Halalkalibacillus sediminis]|uniref:YqzL family protein n=1 Tax=Halalkalibacillus sediminis TaxID=2018042 RepID=A0A2I0QXF6_9BACI|nr:YqzL family protein [Halalkalibacillus sediminis]PKR79022.1 YqzL family protein [Halalkalibacillus sediminis]